MLYTFEFRFYFVKNIVILSKMEYPSKNEFKIFFMGAFGGIFLDSFDRLFLLL